jgi:multiple sugar transport system ATP-binding protein
MAEITLRAVSKTFTSGVEAVHPLDLDLPDGSFTVLVGPSGCGKTTTLRMIAGLESVSTGRISIGGRDVTGLEPKDRNVAMVFQNYALYPHLDVRDNVGFALEAMGVPRAERHRRVEEVAAALDIAHLLDRRPRALSGGQQQRVAIARAIVREPDVFLFDEPLSNLDAKLRVATRTELLRLQRRLGATMVYVTHDQEEAMTLADRLVVMDQGTIAQEGPPRDVYRRPASRFVARFIGSPEINLLDGRTSAGRVEAGPLALELAAAADGELTIGIRPDAILRADGPLPARTSGPVRARVDVVELLGSAACVHLDVDGTELRMLVPEDEVDRDPEGAWIDVVIDLDRVHLFDADGDRAR